jgi:hypothetical protein
MAKVCLDILEQHLGCTEQPRRGLRIADCERDSGYVVRL